MSTVGRRLYRSRTDRMISGVCGGLADYFDVDTVLVRVTFLILGLLHGVGIIGYIVLVIIMPEQPLSIPAVTSENLDEDRVPPSDAQDARQQIVAPEGVQSRQRRRWMAGLILILLGALFLLGNFGLFWWLNFNLVWPLILVVLGAALLIRNWR